MCAVARKHNPGQLGPAGLCTDASLPGAAGRSVCTGIVSPQALSWHLIHERIPLSLGLQAGLDCCCLALQLPGLWAVVSSAEFVTHACSLIHCVRFILEAGKCMPSVTGTGRQQGITGACMV